MTTDTASILFTGDLHLGRHPTRIPKDVDGPAFSPKAVWEETVAAAIERDVDLVALSGDVVDRDNRFFEAYGSIESGFEKLVDADVPVVVVAGNHDYDVLSRMVDELDLDGVRLLGRDGDWERWTLQRAGDSLLHVDGWSFADEYVVDSPLDDYELPESSDVPVLGLLHADLDVAESRYAPVSSGDLAAQPADGWLLGHVHAPNIASDADPFVQYPGSPQPLDPGEPGRHGPWLLDVDRTGSVAAEQLPLATLRYSRLEVDVAPIEASTAIARRISEAVESHLASPETTGDLELLLPRIELTGRTDLHRDVVDRRDELLDQLRLQHGSVSVRPESLDVRTRPEADLAELEMGDGPAAFLAGVLLDLSEDDRTVSDELVTKAETTLNEAYTANTYAPLRQEDRVDPPDETTAREQLQTQARTLLHTLLEQKEGSA